MRYFVGILLSEFDSFFQQSDADAAPKKKKSQLRTFSILKALNLIFPDYHSCSQQQGKQRQQMRPRTPILEGVWAILQQTQAWKSTDVENIWGEFRPTRAQKVAENLGFSEEL